MRSASLLRERRGPVFELDGSAVGVSSTTDADMATWTSGGALSGYTRRAPLPAWLVVWLPVCAVTALITAAYYPGVMRPDSLDQYRQAVNGHYTDWHPPVMAWLWGLMEQRDGPRPMFLLHLLLNAIGTGLIAGALRDSGRPETASLVLLASVAPIPLGYVGVIMKDTTLAVSLLAATGIIAHFTLRGRSVPLTAGLCAALLLAFGTMLRFNAPFATVPLLLCLIPGWTLVRPLRRMLIGILALGLVLTCAPLATEAVFRPERTNVKLSPVIYDLAGITYHSGRNRFPDLAVDNSSNLRAVQCYTPFWWDTYGSGDCAFVFERIGAMTREKRFNPYEAWLEAVLTEPWAYLRHRLSHVNSNLRFLLPYGTSDVTFMNTSPNEFGFTFQPNGLTSVVQQAGLLEAATPAGWPITWIALSLGCLIMTPALRPGPVRGLMTALALSALIYGGSYLVFSVASDLRYHLWTMMAAALATALCFGEALRQERLPTRRATLALTPVAIVAMLGLVWRLLDLPAA